MTMMRLQKFLSAAGVCSRRQGEAHIRAGRVTVNGQVVSVLGAKVDPDTDRIRLDGVEVRKTGPTIYVMLNKPAGYVTSCRHHGEAVVTDLVNLSERLFPVGRLDKDSTGLLLLTNDGRIHHRLSHPSFDHEKEYDVTVQRPIDDHALNTMASGMLIAGEMTRPARVQRVSARRFRIVLQEGKNRQIRRMVKKTGNRVVRLNRIRVADLRLGDLRYGQWRHLGRDEVRLLLDRLGLEPSHAL
jgi:pseudouridine synthase